MTESDKFGIPHQGIKTYNSWFNISSSKIHLMEKGLVNPNWLVTTRITSSFPFMYDR